MKRLVLLPKTDTITICLPTEWVGHPIICFLKASESIIYEEETQEDAINYTVKHLTGRKRKIRRADYQRRKMVSHSKIS
jgi:hypothetical protein